MYSAIRHIFFDLDHTLWDFETNSREALHDLFVKDGLEQACKAPYSEFIKAYEAINHRYWQLYGEQKVTKEELRYKRFHDAFVHFGYDNETLARQWADDYLRLSPYKTNLVHGSLDVLDHLKEKYTLHLITNGFIEVQNIKLDHSRLRPYFQNIIISEEHGFNKPDVRIFRLAEALSAAKPEECLMIGDNYETDITGAQQAGWQAIHLDPLQDGFSKGSEKAIKTLPELKALL